MHTDCEELRCVHCDHRSQSQSFADGMRMAFAVGRSTVRNGFGQVNSSRIFAVVRIDFTYRPWAMESLDRDEKLISEVQKRPRGFMGRIHHRRE